MSHVVRRMLTVASTRWSKSRFNISAILRLTGFIPTPKAMSVSPKRSCISFLLFLAGSAPDNSKWQQILICCCHLAFSRPLLFIARRNSHSRLFATCSSAIRPYKSLLSLTAHISLLGNCRMHLSHKCLGMWPLYMCLSGWCI